MANIPDVVIACERVEISRLECKPGDIVAIKCLMSSDSFPYFNCYLKDQFPDLKFMLLPSDCELAVIQPAAAPHDPFQASTVLRDRLGI